ncbi:porin family protein [Legionella sp. km772]|nr:porin family protein [Legionella sp. km772]
MGAIIALNSLMLSPNFAAIKKNELGKDEVDKTRHWRWTATLSGGAAFSDSVGRSQFIPIVNPIEDEFFNYAAAQSNQTEFLWGVSLAMEFGLNQNWLLQSGFSYYQPTLFHPQGMVAQGIDALSVDNFSYQYEIQARQVLFENKLLYNLSYKAGAFHPYASVGIGLGINSSSNYRVNITPPFTTFSNQFTNGSDSAFSYRVGLGVDYDLTTKLRIGIGYRFADFGKTKLGNAFIDQVPTFNNLSQAHLYTNEVLGQFTFLI